MKNKQIIGDPIVINGRTLSLSKAIRAGDFIFLTGQVPMKDGKIVESGFSNQVFEYPKEKYTKKLLSAAIRYASDW